MQQLTTAGQNIVNDLSQRYNLSKESVIHMISAVNNGGGTMAQFSCPELGSGQWMLGGMTMAGDLFNYGLNNTINNLCTEISNLLSTTQIFPVIPAGTPGSNQWWPIELGQPSSSGAQNNIRYAVFPNRLAVELNGQVTVYDTLNHNIGGVSQQQGGDTSLTFSSQFGTISVSSLPIISGPGNLPPTPRTNFAEPVYDNPTNPAQQATSLSSEINQSSDTILQLIEKLSQLYDAGALTDEEFNSKKSELLSRL